MWFSEKNLIDKCGLYVLHVFQKWLGQNILLNLAVFLILEANLRIINKRSDHVHFVSNFIIFYYIFNTSFYWFMNRKNIAGLIQEAVAYKTIYLSQNRAPDMILLGWIATPFGNKESPDLILLERLSLLHF